MEIKELKAKLEEQAFRLNKAKSNGTMVNQETERMKNLIINNYEAIVDALAKAEKLEREVSILNIELDDAERELDEMKQGAGTKKTTAKKKADKPVEADE